MLGYFIRRILIASVTLVLISFVIYGIARSMPGDPLSLMMHEASEVGGLDRQANTVFYREMRKEFGLDQHWFWGYFKWLGGVVRGDLGKSFTDRLPVTAVISARIGPTPLFSAGSIFLGYLLSIPLGVYCGARSGRL